MEHAGTPRRTLSGGGSRMAHRGLLLAILLALAAPHRVLADECDDLDRAGRPVEARAALVRALQGTMAEARGDTALRGEAAARAELLLLRLLDRRTGRDSELFDVLRALEPEAPTPRLSALLRRGLLDIALAAGAVAEAARLRDGLGFITEGWIAGPFDNERGAGYDAVLEPEQCVDLAATLPGKDRPVAWRRLPSRPPSGILSLGEAMSPSEQAMAYIATIVVARHDCDAALAVGSSDAVRIFVNGAPVLSRDVTREYHGDQDLAGVRLAAGPNLLLIKSLNRSSDWLLSVRIMRPDGGPLDGVTVTADPERLAEASRTRPRDGVVAPDPGAPGWFEARAAAPGAGAEAILDLVRLELLRGAEDHDSARITARIEAALANGAGDPRLHCLLAESLDRPVEMAEEKDENRRRAALEKAVLLDPGHMPALLDLALHDISSSGNVRRALRRLDAALRVNPDSGAAKLLRFDALRALGLEPPARRLLATLVHDADPAVRPIALARRASMLDADRWSREALDAWRDVLGHDATDAGARERVIEIAEDIEEAALARSAAEDGLALDPWSVGLALRFSRLAEAAGDAAAAEAAVEGALAVNPDDAEALVRRGDLCFRQGRRGAALESWNRALVLTPNDKTLRRIVEHLTPSVKPFEDSFPVDAAAVVAGAPDPARNPENRSHRHLLRRTLVRVHPDGTASRFEHQFTQILNEGGTRLFDYFAVRGSNDEVVTLRIARVHRRGGAVVDVPVGGGGRISPFAAVSLPPLEPGDIVELAHRREDVRQSYFGNYFGMIHLFQAADLAEVRRSELTLLLPQSRPFHFHARGLPAEPASDAPREGERVVTFAMENLPALDADILMPPLREFAAQIQVTTWESWDAFAAWWWQLIRREFDVTPAMRAKLASLLEGRTTVMDRIRAVYAFVVSEVRYVAWEFGVHGYKPYRTSVIFDRRFGDCKDKAILINTLLAEAGITAWPVLLAAQNRRETQDFTLPLIDHFNHCISYFPGDADHEPFWMDGTAEYHGLDELPSGDRGARVVVVEDGKAVLRGIPEGGAADDRMERRYRIRVLADLSAEVELEARALGLQAPEIRRRFHNPAERRDELLRELVDVFGDVRILEETFSDLDDLAAPVSFQVRFAAPGLVRDAGSGPVLPLVLHPHRLSALAAAETRRFDLLLGTPESSDTVVTWELDGSLEVAGEPQGALLEGPGLEAAIEASVAGQTIRVRNAFALHRTRVAVADYPAFRDFIHRLERAEAGTLRLARRGK